MAALLDRVGAGRAIVADYRSGATCRSPFTAHTPSASAPADDRPRTGLQERRAREAWNKRALDTGALYEKKALRLFSPSAANGRRRSTGQRGLARAARGMLTQQDASVIQSLPESRFHR